MRCYSGPEHTEQLEALKEQKVKRVIVSESMPYLEQDALLLQQTYRALS